MKSCSDAARRQYGRVVTLLLIVSAPVLLASCANPRRPPGGPRDETPPAVASSEPPTGATNVSPREIHIRFSEYVEPTSFAGAFSLTPTLPSGRPEFDWSGRTVTISLPSKLRENTTYIVTLGSSLQDVRGVSLDQPITLAFATGPRINKGRLTGHVVGAARGQPRPESNVFAYAAPDTARLDSLPERPIYRTQTGSDGRFTFNYLREQPYFVIALKDQNGNRRLDPGEPFAVPPRPALAADSARGRDTLRWIMTERDERPPAPQRIRVQSRRRLSVSFNEAVRLTESARAAWPLTDSMATTSEVVRQVYMRSEAPRRVSLLTADTLRAHPYWLAPRGVADSSGHPARADTLRFDPSGAPPDTMQLRLRGFLPEQTESGPLVLGPRQMMRLRFNQPPPDSLASFVRVADTSGNRRPFSARTANGTVYRLRPDPPLPPDSMLVVRVTLPNRLDTTYQRRYRRLSESELGGLVGVVHTPDTLTDRAGAVVVEITPTGETKRATSRAATVQPGKQFAFNKLPTGDYRVRLFWDQNGNGTWDGGRLVPYEPPEPVRWMAEPAHVRARWDTDLDTLRLEG